MIEGADSMLGSSDHIFPSETRGPESQKIGSSRGKTAAHLSSSSEAQSTTARSANALPPVLHHLVQLFDEIIATTDRVATTALAPSPFLLSPTKLPAAGNALWIYFQLGTCCLQEVTDWEFLICIFPYAVSFSVSVMLCVGTCCCKK